MLQAIARQWTLDLASSSLVFGVRHLLTTVQGRFNRFSVDLSLDPAQPTLSRVAAFIDTTSIDTDLAQRDEHLRELFDTKRYPRATFISHGVERDGGRLRVLGELSLRGRARPVELRASMISVTPRRVVVDAFGRLSREAFGLRWSPVVELTSGVADFVDLTMRISVVR